MERDYYKEYYRLEREHWWFLARNNIVINHVRKFLPKNQKTKILNIGVATGRTSELLAELGEVTSVEYDKDCCDFVRRKINIDVMNASILDLPFEDSMYDLVCAFDVIEHVEDDTLAMSEMKRVCKDRGIISVTVPAFNFLWSHHDEINHHHRRYTKQQLLALINAKDKVIYSSYFNFWLFFPIAVFRFLSSRILSYVHNGKNGGSDFSVGGGSKLLNDVLFRLFNSENFFVSRSMRLPVGISILATWRNQTTTIS